MAINIRKIREDITQSISPSYHSVSIFYVQVIFRLMYSSERNLLTDQFTKVSDQNYSELPNLSWQTNMERKSPR